VPRAPPPYACSEIFRSSRCGHRSPPSNRWNAAPSI